MPGEGVDVNTLSAHIDFFKTFCELAWAKIPGDIQEIDGRSMLPLLENPKATLPDRQLFVHKGRWEKGEHHVFTLEAGEGDLFPLVVEKLEVRCWGTNVDHLFYLGVSRCE